MADSEIKEIQEQSRRLLPVSPESGYAFASSERERGRNSADGEELSLFPVRHFQLDKPVTSPQLGHYETRQWRPDQERPASAQKSDVGQRILGLPARRVALREAQMPQNPQASLGFEDSQSRNLFSAFIPRAAISAMDRQRAPGGTVGQPADPAHLNQDGWFPTLNQLRPHSPKPRLVTGQAANQQPQRSQRPAVRSTPPAQADDATRLGHIRTGAGPVESNPLAWNAFMQGLDNQKVGGFTVGELANVLTNESRDLSFIGPSVSLFDNDLDQAKYVQAHAIINNALRKIPNGMANRTVTRAAAASRGHDRDVAIMRQAYFDRMTRGADPAQGRTYFGNSAEVLNSRPIGNSRQTPFVRFGPFVLGSQSPQYIYVFNDPIKKQPVKKGKH